MAISDTFHTFYEQHRLWKDTTWMGVPMYKLPFDAFVIQELICKVKPNFIIETGTGEGGSAIFYASLCELFTGGKVITIDINDKFDIDSFEISKIKNRIIKVYGSSTNPLVFEKVKNLVGDGSALVVLDSNHRKKHVVDELDLYSQLVNIGSYIIVEDTHVNYHPVPWEWGDGPMEAVHEFLEINDNFVIDSSCEKHMMTFNPRGYLRRVK